MTSTHALTIKQALNKSYRLIKPKRQAMEAFKGNLIKLLDDLDEKESEENVKIHLMDFLKNTYYAPDLMVATKGKTDFVIHTGKEAKSRVGVLFEVKRPFNKSDMVTRENQNAKAMHELILYYLRERVDGNNTDIRHLVITNIYEWFIFDAQDFERVFGKNVQLKKDYQAWKTGQKVSSNTDHFYKEVAKPFLESLSENLPFTYFNIKDFEKPLRNDQKSDDNKLIGLYKVLSPIHLLKLPFLNDSNSLDSGFYKELLHLIGLEEVKDGNKKLIRRKPTGQRNEGSLLENTISILENENYLTEVTEVAQYGNTNEERFFNIGLELCITWINRILFLKLLEAQLIKYHHGDQNFRFLNFTTLPEYDDVNRLFFWVLAIKPENRNSQTKAKFGFVPYLNSSLFEKTDLEKQTITISNLFDKYPLDLYNGTVLRDAKNKPIAASLNSLEYLLRFLDAYDFASEGREEIQEESKTLINASVLGLIFEKINGYKDGSIYTPGFITMYMCRQTVRQSVLQKFNQAYSWQAENFDDLKNYLAQHHSTTKILEFNKVLNNLHICDPAVGSGHFLVSALNELITIKSELNLLADSKGVRISNHEVTIENDELIVTDRSTLDIFEYTVNSVAGSGGFKVSAETQRVQETLFHEKQTLIENCLFGVDINTNSVKICRLRLWIELLKNTYYTQQTNFTELETLPNIDINIKHGNSLISRFKLNEGLGKALKHVKYTVKEYREFVQAYKETHDKERKRELENVIKSIKTDFKSEFSRNSKEQIRFEEAAYELNKKYPELGLFDEKLTTKQKKDKAALQLDVAKKKKIIDEIKNNVIYRNAFEWRFEFPEVLDNEGNFEGFDAVIGNPPYIRQEELSELKPYLKQQYQVFAGTADLLVYFIERGVSILKPGGNFSYIIANKFMRAGFGKPLRIWLQNYQLKQIIDFGDLPVFDEATTYPCILSLQKHIPEADFTALNIESLGIENFEKFVLENAMLLSQKSLKEDGWNLTRQEGHDLLEKLKNAGIPLSQKVGGKIYRGLLTGLNEAFVIEEIIKERLIAEDPNSQEIIKPFLIGRDVKRYSQPISGKHIILFRSGFTAEKFGKIPEQEAWTKISNEYPAITAFLSPYKEKAKARLDQGQYWWELRACAYYDEFEEPKIIWPGISLEITPFGKDQTGFYGNDNTHLIINDDNYLLGLLNSSVSKYYLSKVCDFVRGGYARLKVSYVSTIPIANATENDQKTITALVNQILSTKQADPQADTSVMEHQIDQLVYELYQLNSEEIAIIEGAK